MLFNHSDLKELKNNLEYIDTAIIPVSNLDINHQLLSTCDQAEMIQLVGMLVEKQFKGRLLLTPAFFTSNETYAHVKNMIYELKEFGLKNIIILSGNSMEKLNEDDKIYTINTIPMSDLDDEMKKELVEDEVKRFMKFIIKTWNS